MSDGPHGVRRQLGDADHLGIADSEKATCFPTASALAATWNPDLARQMGEALGAEARGLGVNVLLGPGLNIKRSPLCGRNFEYLSEDPILRSRDVGGIRCVCARPGGLERRRRERRPSRAYPLRPRRAPRIGHAHRLRSDHTPAQRGRCPASEFRHQCRPHR